MVVSQNFSSATSLAMLAPIRTLTSICSFSRMMSEISVSPSGPSSMPWMTIINYLKHNLYPEWACGLEMMVTHTGCDCLCIILYYIQKTHDAMTAEK